jgi:hypothetical protein
MRKSLLSLLVCGALAPAAAFAADSDADVAEVGREIGAVLGWRLGPEVVEEKCRDADPAGADARSKALKTWQNKNAALIQTVDERVAEVVPLAYPAPSSEKVIAAVRAKVKQLLLETVSAEGDAAQLKSACEAEANPARPLWTSNGIPHVHNSLAALYDWKTQREEK